MDFFLRLKVAEVGVGVGAAVEEADGFGDGGFP